MDSDPTKSPLNVESAGFKEWQCQRSVRCECSKTQKEAAAANTNSNQSPLANAGSKITQNSFKDPQKGSFFVSKYIMIIILSVMKLKTHNLRFLMMVLSKNQKKGRHFA